MIPFKQSVWDAFNILQDIKNARKKDIPNLICEAQEIVAWAYGVYILPAMQWSVESASYSTFENMNYIALFIGSVASDIRTYENERECDLWLKSLGKEWLIVEYAKRVLVTFDDAYRKWHERQTLTLEQVQMRKASTVERCNRTFREGCIGNRGIYLVKDLDNA